MVLVKPFNLMLAKVNSIHSSYMKKNIFFKKYIMFEKKRIKLFHVDKTYFLTTS
jgi:hypothetical protein